MPKSDLFARLMKVSFGTAMLSAVMLMLTSLSSHAEQQAYQLGSGDKIRVTVFGEDDLSGNFVVDGKGAIAMPLIGEVLIGGKTLRAAETEIVTKLLDGFLKQPRVSLEVLNFRPFYILGEVNRPGSYPYVDGMTVLNAVALAGGFTYRANEKEVIITRDTDLNKRETETTTSARVFPGDMIRVKERFF